MIDDLDVWTRTPRAPAVPLPGRPDEPVRLLAEDGTRLPDPRWGTASCSAPVLLSHYEDMVVVRAFDRTATILQRQGELALWPPLLGQEAAQVGSARVLEPGDFVFSSYREHAVAWCRGATPADLVRVWRGVAVSGWDPYAIGMATPQVVVGAQALHATGWALGAQWEGAGQAAITYFGDGATSEGDVAEAMVFAASFGAPVVFFCQNNGWAISEPTALQTPGSLAVRAAGFGMPAVTVDGNDVVAVAAVTAEALDRARTGGGPTFVEAVTYRMGPHTTADDPTRYRDEAELARWRHRDPVARLRAHLERRRGARRRGRGGRRRAGRGAGPADADRLHHARRPGAAVGLRPRLRRRPPRPAARACAVRPAPGCLRRRAGMSTATATRTATTMTLGAAIGAGLRTALEADEKVVLLGEDIGRLGGVYRVTDGLQRDFGPHRVVDTPLAESGILGAAVGLAYRGWRPVCEIQFDGFVYPAFDQVVSQVARMHARTRGAVRMPITVRIPVGGGIGAAEHHSDSPEAYFAHTPGLRVISVATPQDAYDAVVDAVASDDPVVFFEPKRRYHVRGEVVLRDRTDARGSTAAGLGGARVVLPGTDVTLVTWGGLVQVALDAARAAVAEGVSIEVVDLRSLSPVDHETVAASVRRTGRLVVTHEAPERAGLGAEVVAGAVQRCFAELRHAPVRVTGWDVPYPPARLERHHLPDLDRILDGVDHVLGRPSSFDTEIAEVVA